MSMKAFLKDSNTTVIDVREPEEFQEQHVEGAINIPLAQIGTILPSDEKVYVICRSGRRSKWATNMLRKRGIEAYNVKGGMLQYVRHKKKKSNHQ